MNHILTLYVGDTDSEHAMIVERLQSWSSRSADLEIVTRSIHSDPSAAVRLGIAQLPALVYGDQLITQGTPADWFGEELLEKLANRLDQDRC